MTGATTQGGTLQLVATATGSTLAALDQHQMKADPARGNTRMGTDRLTPAVVHDNSRDWMASRHAGFTYIQNCSGFCRVVSPRSVLTSSCELGADFGRRPFHQNSHRLPVLPRSSRQRVRFSLGCTRVHSLRLADCSPLLRNSLPYQQLVKCLADRRHFPKALSSVARLVGIQPNERRLTNAQRSFAPGAKAND